MKLTWLNIGLSSLILGVLVYIILKWRNSQRAQNVYAAASTGQELITVIGGDYGRVNVNKIISEGDTGPEVTALQLMVQKFIPSQGITGVMDPQSWANLNEVRKGIKKGGTTVTDFRNVFFMKSFTKDEYHDIINKFQR